MRQNSMKFSLDQKVEFIKSFELYRKILERFLMRVALNFIHFARHQQKCLACKYQTSVEDTCNEKSYYGFSYGCKFFKVLGQNHLHIPVVNFINIHKYFMCITYDSRMTSQCILKDTACHATCRQCMEWDDSTAYFARTRKPY